MRIFSLNNFKDRRRDLRKRSTSEEDILWARLRAKRLGLKFRRQHSIGRYIVDFYCPSKKLIIELDGNQHLGAEEYDKERNAYFESLGIKVLRFWNEEIHKGLGEVVTKIMNMLE